MLEPLRALRSSVVVATLALRNAKQPNFLLVAVALQSTSIMHEHCAMAFEIVFRVGLGQLLAWNGGSIYLVKANPGCVIRPTQMGHGMGTGRRA